MAIRQARLEAPALSAPSHEGMVNGWAASGEKKIDSPEAVARFGDILNREGPLVEIGPRSVFANSVVGIAAAGGGAPAHDPTPLAPAPWGGTSGARGVAPIRSVTLPSFGDDDQNEAGND